MALPPRGIVYRDSEGAMVTIPNVTLIDQRSTGFTFASSDGGTYFLSNAPIRRRGSLGQPVQQHSLGGARAAARQTRRY